MALTYSEMVPLGKEAPDFTLQGIDDRTHSLSSYQDKKGYVIMFLCVHCPYVVAVQNRIAALAKEFSSQAIQFIGINSNDYTRYPDDSPEGMKAQAKKVGFEFPYLIDENQTVAKEYGAVCTPDIFVFDSSKKLVYRGRIDDNWKEPEKVIKQDLKDALTALVHGKPVSTEQVASMGCSIKWKNHL
ncbi:MAG: thioredoxin family protein [Bacteriovoracia bacterium]